MVEALRNPLSDGEEEGDGGGGRWPIIHPCTTQYLPSFTKILEAQRYKKILCFLFFLLVVMFGFVRELINCQEKH